MTNYHKYLPVTEREIEWGFYITTVGYSETRPDQSYPTSKEHPATHSFTWNTGRILDGYYLIFIARGKGIFESAVTKPAIIEEGSCFLLFPGVWHRYKPVPKSGWEEYWVGFKGSYPEQLMEKDFFNKRSPVIRTGHNIVLLELFQKLVDIVKATAEGYHQVITGITLQLLGMVHAHTIDKQEQDSTAQLIAKAKFFMQENLEKEIDMQQLVKELPMGYSNFRKAFKQFTGQSPTQYHIHLRINKARELLVATHLSINEIASQTGFDSVFYFSRLFKEKIGVPPTWYRNQ
jgi:AraC-like DNA-binding protein